SPAKTFPRFMLVTFRPYTTFVALDAPEPKTMERCYSHAVVDSFWPILIVLAACGGPDANSPSRPLPAYEGHQAELFDDAIDPRAVGLNLDEARTPQTDAA